MAVEIERAARQQRDVLHRYIHVENRLMGGATGDEDIFIAGGGQNTAAPVAGVAPRAAEGAEPGARHRREIPVRVGARAATELVDVRAEWANRNTGEVVET